MHHQLRAKQKETIRETPYVSEELSSKQPGGPSTAAMFAFRKSGDENTLRGSAHPDGRCTNLNVQNELLWPPTAETRAAHE